MDDIKAKEEMRAKAHALNPIAWILDNKFVNENQKPFEFTKHRFMIQPYSDSSPDQVIIKSAQVGWSVLAILKSIHACNFIKLNVIYVLPTRNATHDFVIPKVNPMLERNPIIKQMLKNTDSVNLKQVGDRFLYFRGSFHRGEAISTTGDLIVSDEHDVSDQGVITIYQSRLQASEYGWFWRFSNPTIPGFGVHELWQDSDQMHWFVTCEECGHVMYMDFERDDALKPHYVDPIRKIYACGECHKEISNKERQNGYWWALYPNRERRGYWICQMMCPWVSAKKILQQEKDMSVDVFHNFVLGKAYQASEFMLNSEAILRACKPGLADKTDVIIGCDSGKTKHYVIGNTHGIFNYGKTESWADIESLINSFNATCVIDALPDFTVPEQLARKYPGRVFVHYYTHDSKRMDTSQRNEGSDFGRIDSDRTKLFDQLAGEIASQKIIFYQSFKDLQGSDGKGLVYHVGNIYRVVENDKQGIQRARWMCKENKPDHWAHAMAFYRVGLSQMIGSNEVGGVKTAGVATKPSTYAVRRDGTVLAREALHMDIDTLVDKSIAKQRRRKIKNG